MAVASALEEFMAKFDMSDEEFSDLELKVGQWESHQLASVLVGGLPAPVASYLRTQVSLSSGGLVVLRALAKTFRRWAGKEMLQEATSAVLKPVGVESGCDLLASLAGWSKQLQVLATAGERPSDMQLKEALVKMVGGLPSELGMAKKLESEEAMEDR